MRATLARRHGMDLVDDHCAGGLQHGAPRVRAEEDVERLGCGHHDMRREFSGALTLGLGCVPGAHPGAGRDIRQALCTKRLPDADERNVEIAVNVVRERFKRRDIDDLRLVLKPVFEPLAHEPIDGTEEGGERLAGAGRRGNQHVAASLDRGPGVGLCRRGRGEALVEPRANRGVEEVEWHEKPVEFDG